MNKNIIFDALKSMEDEQRKKEQTQTQNNQTQTERKRLDSAASAYINKVMNQYKTKTEINIKNPAKSIHDSIFQ
jgi:hypothetical protein